MRLVPAQIIGTGHYSPERVLDNKELAASLGVTEDWIFSRTGIKSRYICADHQTTSEIALYASLDAIDEANISPQEIDLIIFCTLSPDKLCPSTACNLQKELKAVHAACFDLEAACSGSVFGLATAYQYIATGMYETVLVVGADLLSKFTDYSDQSSCILFGDGAGAVVVKSSDENSFSPFLLGSDGSLNNLIHIQSSGIAQSPDLPPYLRLKGKEVFKWAVSKVPKIIQDALNKAELAINDIDYFIFHQANQRITNAISNRLGLDPEKVLSNIETYGNTSAASIPILLSQAHKNGKLRSGQKILLAGFGGGISWGVSIIDWKI
jgi:3-oxoacyl-[acyl-carrier-protein] synthase-3